MPENKGSNANIFYILQNKKPGATIHYVNSNIDSGAIIDQEYLKTDLTDTGFKLQKNGKSLVRLLLKNWDRIIKFYRNDLFITK